MARFVYGNAHRRMAAIIILNNYLYFLFCYKFSKYNKVTKPCSHVKSHVKKREKSSLDCKKENIE